MATYVSLLRGINVGGKRRVPMAELRALYESLGMAGVETYVQSGNVVFDSARRSAARIGERLEQAIEARFGFAVPVVVRTSSEISAIIAANPFSGRRGVDPARLHVTFLSGKPGRAAGLLRARRDAPDELAPGEREVFLHCPGGYGRTKFSNAWFERELGLVATTRNWKTVNALCELALEARTGTGA